MCCLDKQMELQAYVDGDLKPEQTAVLEAHLAGCDDCRAALARLQAVVAALETWPLVDEPAQTAGRVMARVRPRSTPPRFRLHWSDVALSTLGAALALTGILLWRHLSSAYQHQFHSPEIHVWLEMLRLEALLIIHRLTQVSAMAWWPLLTAVATVVVLAIIAWDHATRRRRVLSI